MKTMRFIKCALIVLLSCMAATGWAQRKIGMMLPETPTVSAEDHSLTIPDGLSDDEKAATQWFYDEYISPTRYAENEVRGTFVSTGFGANDYDVVWVMIDRNDIARNAVATTLGSDKVNALKAYYKAGGNVLFTNAATQLLIETERLPNDFGPNLWDNDADNKKENADAWYIWPGKTGWTMYNYHDMHKGHQLYCGCGSDKIYLNNSTVKKDHSYMWNFSAFSFDDIDDAKGRNNLYKFQYYFKSNVIGVWGGISDEGDNHFERGAILEFAKTDGYGLSMAIGAGAYEWATEQTNDYADNLKRMTRNALRHLGMRTQNHDDAKIGFVVLLDNKSKIPGYDNSEYQFKKGDFAENDPNKISDDEYMAYKWFADKYGKENVLDLHDLATTDITDFDAIWVHIDRDIQYSSVHDGGTDALGAYHYNEYDTKKERTVYKVKGGYNVLRNIITAACDDDTYTKAYNALKNYYKNGGNLLLTSQAGLLLSKDSFGRIEKNPIAMFYEPNNLEDAKLWGINAHSNCPDRRNHPIYNKINGQFMSRDLHDGDYLDYDIYPLLIGRGSSLEVVEYADKTGFSPTSENHNFWFEGYSDDVLYEKEHCTILGQWGQDQVYEDFIPCLVDVHPTALFAGRAITIGFGAYDWCLYEDLKEGENAETQQPFANSGELVLNSLDADAEKTPVDAQANIKQLTENALTYLLGSDKIEVEFNKVGQGYSTMFYSYYDLVVPDNTTACIYGEVSKDKEFNDEHGWNEQTTVYQPINSGEVITAGTPVVLFTKPDAYEAEAGATKLVRRFSTISNYGPVNAITSRKPGSYTDDLDATEYVNLLHGNNLATTITDGSDNSKYYVVSVSKDGKGKDAVAFYWYTPNGCVSEKTPLNVPAHRAYLKLTPDQQANIAKYIRLPFMDCDEEEQATGIDSRLETENSKPNACYTLQGVKVDGDNLMRGIYIVNGKKVIVK